MKKKSLVAVVLLAVSLFALWQARQFADHRRADSVMRSLCREIQGYRQLTGQLPTNLDMIADGKKADWLKDLTNAVSITYDPGAQDRMPYLAVSVGHASISVQGPSLDYP
jgi:hypothetical protein